MRAIHLVLSFVALLLSLISTAQIQLGLIDRIIHNDPTVSVYKQKNLCAFMAVAALDHKTRSVYLISAFGGIEDSMHLPENEYEQLRNNQTTPFELFDRAYTNAINNIRQTREVIRSRVQNSSNKLPSAINVVFPLLENTVSDFEKIVFLDEFYAHAIIKKHLLKISNPKHTITNDSVYSNTEKVQAGSMQIHKDSAIWYSSSYASTLLKAKLFVARSVIVYYDRNGIAVDSLLLNSKKLPVLTAKKTNVFLLYRNLQETRVQQLLKRIRALENEQKKNNNYYQNAARKINGEGDSATYLENSLHQLLEQIALVVTPDIKAVNSYIRDFADEHETANHLLRVLNVPYVTHYNRGIKYYELTDHRGNIMAVVSDKKKGVDSNNDDKIDYYKAEVSSATDYASFGAYLPERTLQSAKHRYGFNGKENDNEVKGEGNQVDYGARVYDPRLGKFLSVDPLTKKFPWYTPYQFAGNKPIWASDLDGMEEWMRTQESLLRQRVQLQQQTSQTQQKLAALKAMQVMAQAPTLSPADNSYSSQLRSQQLHAQAQFNTNIAGATMDPLAAGMAYPAANAVGQYAKGVVQHGYGIYSGIKEGEYGETAKNAGLLALDVAPFVPLKVPLFGKAIEMPKRLVRVVEEKYAGSPTLGAPGSADVFVTAPAELQGLSSKQIAEKLTMVDKNNIFIKGPFRLIEFDTPQGLAQPLNRNNPGFINGGKTAGGAVEYTVPNVSVSSLKNVSQKTVQ